MYWKEHAMQFIDPGFKGHNPGHYETAVVSKGMLYISGLLSIDPDTREPCRGDIVDHCRQTLSNLDRVLAAANCRRDQVVFCRVLTPSVDYTQAINAEYAAFFGDHRPGRVMVPTTKLHMGSLVIIDAVAELDA
ncbi:MAG: Rid family hydrolase [Sutterella sp.]|nr:Rid family hydrolase [Sutterella sp.]